MRIALVRHGQTDWNRERRLQGTEDIPLNGTGRDQAAEAGEYLRRWSWDAVVASPLQRAVHTARIIAACNGLPEPGTLEELRERDYGEASGLLVVERERCFPDGNAPGMEPLDALFARAQRGLDRCVELYHPRNLIVVAHGGILNAMLHQLSGGEIGTGKTWLSNACVSMAEYREGEFRLEFYNRALAGMEQAR